MQTVDAICRQCGGHFARPVQRGRPQVRCNSCKEKDEKQNISNMIAAKLAGNNQSNPPTKIEEEQEPARAKPKYDPNVPHSYRVMVGNLGIAHAGNDKNEALGRFNHYVKASNNGFGQVGFESVQLWELEPAINQYKVIESFTPDRST